MEVHQNKSFDEVARPDEWQNLNLTQTLLKIIEMDPSIGFLDLSQQNITNFNEITPYLVQLRHLKEINLEDNHIGTLPPDLSQALRKVVNLNLNGNQIDDSNFERVVLSLKTMPMLESLYINLHTEDQVDLIMTELQDLKFLNGLPVERDGDEEEGEQEQEDQAEALESPTEIVKLNEKQGKYGSSEKQFEGQPPNGGIEIEYQIKSSEQPSARARNIQEQQVQEIPEQEDMTESFS